MIISRTPFRVSFFGGGTDYPDWFHEHGGAVLATTIDKYCYISVRELPPFFDHRFRVVYSIVENVKDVADIAHPAVRAVLQRLEVDKGLEIHHDGDLPARSGLGSSSAFTVGLLRAIHALRGRHTSKEALASEAIHVEQCMLREPVGLQDQISAAFGGFNHILFRQDGTYEVEPMILPRERLAALQDHLLLVFTGISRLAPDVAQTVIDNLKQRTGELKAMQEMVGRAIELLSSPTADIARVRPAAERILDAEAPVVGSRVELGGGCALRDGDARRSDRRQAARRRRRRLRAAVRQARRPRPRGRSALRKLITVPFKFDMSGCRIALYQPDGL